MNLKSCFQRHFFKILIISILIYAGFIYLKYNSKFYDTTTQEPSKEIILQLNHNPKYILQWTRRFNAPFHFLKQGNSAFILNKCKFTNCFVTDDANYFLDLRDFDAIAFNGKDVNNLSPNKMPRLRSSKQKYIFGAMESPDFFPACNKNLDGFFNWTWTYKLGSDFRWSYFNIYDLNGHVIGPKIDMTWPAKMKPISHELKMKLSNKTKAVAWFVSHCHTKRKREDYVPVLSNELKKWGWTVDVYGACGPLTCPRLHSECFKMIEEQYHFYLSFENSFDYDYVTEKLLTALNNYAIPVVYGGANYTRYLPDGSYLNALELGPQKLAEEINSIIANKTRYYDFFRWRNHYKYKKTEALDVCNLCEWMNNEQKFNETSVWNNFRTWWNGPMYKENCFRQSNYLGRNLSKV